MNWDQMRRQYYRTDGTFRDIYATEMDSLAWQRFFQLLDEYTLTFHTSEDDKPAESAAINAALVERQWDLQEYVPYARVQLPGGVKVKFYFFAPDELEGTLDPREVKSEARHRELKAFLAAVADATGKTVKLCPENNRTKLLYQLAPRPSKEEAEQQAKVESVLQASDQAEAEAEE